MNKPIGKNSGCPATFAETLARQPHLLRPQLLEPKIGTLMWSVDTMHSSNMRLNWQARGVCLKVILKTQSPPVTLLSQRTTLMRRKSGRETQSRFDGFLAAKMRMRHDMEGKNASQAQAHSCGPIQPVKPTKIQIHAPQWSCHPKTDARSWLFQKGNRVPQDSPNPLRLGV